MQANGFCNLYFAALGQLPVRLALLPCGSSRYAARPASFLAIEGGRSYPKRHFHAASRTPEEARANLVVAMETAADQIAAVAAAELAAVWRAHGSLPAAGFVTEAIGRACLPALRLGLMLPVLEDDSILGAAGQTGW
ncbi:MAG: hypothetical protein H6661_08465 [Ardenticatenaceae bacterium]|nr:hypothetical protein [Ardenticatenaceae bacterium]